MPRGRLCIALCDGELAGTAALRPLDDERGEVKRLYVRPEFRGKGIGKTLMEWIEREAMAIGYSSLYLDTVPQLVSAIALYRRLGYVETDCYNNSPVETTIFMKKSLME